jgi:integrase
MPGSMRLVAGKDVWELRVYLGRDRTGRVRHLHRRFHGNKRDAGRALTRLVAEHEGVLPPEKHHEDQDGRVWGEKTTINDAISGWKENGWDDLSPTTVRHYREMWERYIRRSIGRREIGQLSPYEVERYFRYLKSVGVGRTTIRHIRGMLHRSCRLARKWSGNRLPNPISDTELPTFKLDERPNAVRSPTSEEVRALLVTAHKRDPRMGVFLRVVAATGMRRGEACATRWSDIDFDAHTIRVDESIVTTNRTTMVKSPKTRASVRTLAVDLDTIRALADLHSQQEELARDCGLAVDPSAFVFSFEPGGTRPPSPDYMSHSFAHIRQAAKLPADLHLHSLRHFHATVLDSVISEAQKQARLGWSTVQMARHYTDAVPAEDRRAAEHVGRLLPRPPGGKSPRRATGVSA